MKIKFVSNYDNDINIYNSVLNCFKLSEEDRKIITFQEDYDYLAVFNGYREKINVSRDKIIGFLQEPIENINYDRNLHFYCSKIFCQSKDAFKPNSGIIEIPLCMFYSNHTFYNYKNFDNTNFKKNKKLCIFVSGISSPNNSLWVNHNYHKRMKLLQVILNSDLDIDIYGRNLQINDPRYKGSPDNKHEILKNYEYSIAVENVCQKNYVSEKFFDCILNGVVPIYYGSPNVDDVFNKDCHIKLDIEDNNVIDRLKDVASNSTEMFQQAILSAKEKYFITMNPLEKIKGIIHE
jgi:hypothetical protein